MWRWGIRRTQEYKENGDHQQSHEKTTLYTDLVLHPGRVLLRNYRERRRWFLIIGDNQHVLWRERSFVHAQHQCTVWVSIQTWGMQLLQRGVDGHRRRTSKVHLTAPVEFFSFSPALLRLVHCLMCPILPERERKSRFQSRFLWPRKVEYQTAMQWWAHASLWYEAWPLL